jgi:hypothetical protein
LRTARTITMCGAVALLGVLSIVGAAIGQPPPPPPNCFCGPINDCDGVPLSSSAYCTGTQFCACNKVWNEQHTCILALQAICYTPA